ncbi:hypothetical protein CsSME_00010072 [Camellia sinensis var. sinensis]
MQGNYVEDEVKHLIQVALLCTLSSLMERPKISVVVRMLEGDGLAERWEEWQKEEMFWQEFVNILHQNNNWIIAQILFSAYREVSWSPTLYSDLDLYDDDYEFLGISKNTTRKAM